MLVAEKEVKGGVFALVAFQGKLLAAVNNKVQLFKWSAGADASLRELTPECGYHGHILVAYMEARGDFIIVGDIMKSVTLLRCAVRMYVRLHSRLHVAMLRYSSIDGTIEHVSRDPNARWCVRALRGAARRHANTALGV